MTSSESPQKTVFIMGAGASNEVGLPVGKDLMKSIVTALTTENAKHFRDDIIHHAIHSLVREGPSKYIDYYNACSHICSANPLAISIDHFIDQHSGNKLIELCGKLAITREILKAEAKSSLFVDYNTHNHTINLIKLGDNWYTQFWKAITQHCKVSDLTKRFESFAFIIFNYDRCIEHFLYHALKQFYQISDEEAARLVNSIVIYHPYGTVGSLPWQSNINNIQYGGTPTVDQLRELAKKIKTFTEGTESNSSIDSIRELMRTAPRLVFLGFAFHKLNMDLLKSPIVDPERSGQIVFATALNISEYNKSLIYHRLHADYPNNNWTIRNDLKCFELLNEYSNGLEFV